MIKPFFVGLSGGSGSGKTTLAKSLHSHLGSDQTSIFCLDWYYHDICKQPKLDDGSINFDHPSALDQYLLINHLQQLKKGRSVDAPIYNFATHHRSKLTRKIANRPTIFIEGLHTLVLSEVRRILDLKIFIDLSDDIRFIRRLLRDQSERKRSLHGVITQYLTATRPMHMEWILPSRRFADVVLSAENSVSEMKRIVLSQIQATSKTRN